MALAGRTNRTKFRDQVLKPLIEAGFIEMTVPDKPRSSKQRYRTTPAGHAFLANAEKDTQP
jgi:DNA-binding PadR family transcriptional regulator